VQKSGNILIEVIFTALTQEAASISEIPYVVDLDREEVDKILNSD